MRAAPLLPFLLLAASCNTCLNASEVPFRSDDDGGIVQDAGLDIEMADDSDMSLPPDFSRPDQCETLDWCAIAGRACGQFAPADPCAPTTVDCGACGEGGTCAPEGQCACDDGFLPDGEDCVDVDECANGEDDCDDDMFCINEPGSFRCNDCPAGQELAQSGCVDIDECERGTDNCDPLAGCRNLDPGFMCGDCPMGYEDTSGDSSQCDDIDECVEDSLNNCDANATCTNETGSFSCACDAGWVGNGITCSMPGLVVSVTNLTLSLQSGQFRNEVPLPGGVDADQLVPFPTMYSEFADDPDDVFADVFIDVANSELVVERKGSDGGLGFAVSLVEFDPSVTVQSGTFDIGGNSQNVPVSNVNPDESFLVFTNSLSENANRGAGTVVGTLSSAVASFDRSMTSGSATGHFYVVSSPQLSVSRDSVQIGVASLCDSTNLFPTDVSRAVLFYSAEGGGFMGGGAGNLSVNCQIRNNDVQCCRGAVNFLSGVDVEVQLVEFAPTSNASVVRGELTLPGRVAQDALNPAVDPAYSSALAGPSGAAGGAIVEGMTSNEDLGQVTAEIENNGSVIMIERGDNSATDTRSSWQVVEWPH